MSRKNASFVVRTFVVRRRPTNGERSRSQANAERQ
jgi:hypothetical protein